MSINAFSRPLVISLSVGALAFSGLVALPSAASADPTPQIRITEWEYDGSGAAEFSEYTNIGDVPVDLTGWSYSNATPAAAGQIDISGIGTVAPGESFLLTQADAATFRSEWGLPGSVKVLSYGDAGKIGRAATISIFDGAPSPLLVDALQYGDQTVGGVRTQNASGVIPEDALGSNDAAAVTALSTEGDSNASWKSSTDNVGSPGVSGFGNAFDWVTLNEIATNDSPDWFEIYNAAPVDVDATGFVLDHTGGDPGESVTIPDASVVPAHGVLAVDFPDGFKKTDTANLRAADGTTLLDSFTWTNQHGDPSWARTPDGSGSWALSAAATRGALNSSGEEPGDDGGTDPGDTSWQNVKLNEVTSANTDPTHDGYELVNTGDTDVDVAGWKQTDSGSSPAALNSPNGTVVPAHGYLVLLSNQGLSSDGDAVKVYLADGTTLVDSVTWGLNDAQPGSWARCPDATGGWVHTAASSWGASNATACAGDIIPTSTGGPSAPCQSEAASGTGAAIADGQTWPGSATWTQSDTQCEFVTSLSGQDVSGLDFDPSDSNVLWAAKNKSHLYKLVKSGSLWLPDTTNGWGAGKDIVFTSGSGQPDSEGITVGPDGFLYVTTERDNSSSSVPLDTVLRFDPSASGTTLTPTTEWNLTSDFAGTINGSADSNLGFEGITWVPDSYLTEYGFVDQSTGLAYDPTDYDNHGTGLYFLALEKNGDLYAYALGSDGSSHRVADVPTGMPAIADTQWDPDAQRIWAVADNTSSGSTTLLKIGTDGNFAVDRIYDRPTGLPNYNLEGFAIAPDSAAVDGVKEVVRSDDGNNDGHSLWDGTIDTDLGLGEQGPDGPSENLVEQAYRDFLGRDPGPSDVAFWSDWIATHSPAEFVRELVSSDEWIHSIVNGFYTDTLGRAADSTGLAFWTQQLKSGAMSVATVAAQFYSSDEYFAHIGGGTNASWVTDLYVKLLSRSPSPADRDFWAGQLASDSMSRLQVAAFFYDSIEKRRLRVEALYEQLLGRSPDPTGLEFWADWVQTNGDLALAVYLATATDEYLELAQDPH